MARRKMTDKLIKRSQINEEIRLINGSETDYISSKGNIYKDYGNDLFYPKANFINKNNGYLYSSITYPEGQMQRRVHILVAQAFLPNPNNPILISPFLYYKTNHICYFTSIQISNSSSIFFALLNPSTFIV